MERTRVNKKYRRTSRRHGAREFSQQPELICWEPARIMDHAGQGRSSEHEIRNECGHEVDGNGGCAAEEV